VYRLSLPSSLSGTLQDPAFRCRSLPPDHRGRGGSRNVPGAARRGCRSVDPSSNPRVSPTSTIVEVLPRSKPVALDIPSIGVHSSLLSLGLNADGSVQVPSGTSYDEAGWYKFSPTPGSLGPAIILRHVDSGARGGSVFFELGHLRPGNRVMITRRDRSIAVFEITGGPALPEGSFPHPARVRQHEPRGAPADHLGGSSTSRRVTTWTTSSCSPRSSITSSDTISG